MRHDEPVSSVPKRRHPLSTTVKFKRLLEEATLPSYKSEHAAGMDLHACLPDGARKVGIAPGETILVPCGFAMELEPGFEAQVRPRSGGTSLKSVLVPNSPGTIDADYRGEVKVILFNAGRETYIIEHGDRVAQMVICALPRVERVEVQELSETARGDGGFGSTGTK
jgi:dUTP pyrophosphatase